MILKFTTWCARESLGPPLRPFFLLDSARISLQHQHQGIEEFRFFVIFQILAALLHYLRENNNEENEDNRCWNHCCTYQW